MKRSTPTLLVFAAAMLIGWYVGAVRVTAQVSISPVEGSSELSRDTISTWLPTKDARPVGGYWLAYDGRTKSARYVVELLTPSDGDGAGRHSGFRTDPDALPEARAIDDDYAGEPYDRGHLAPSADHEASAELNRATFILSNAAPQDPSLNRGQWRSLEAFVRQIGNRQPCLVVTAPLYLPDAQGDISLTTIGDSNVWVPTHFGKAVYFNGPRGPTAIAWVIPNANPGDGDRAHYDAFRVSIDRFESAAGIDLFAPLPDDLEDDLED
ncbi:MAG: DNA/RNA non-specific endonuclease [Planctomycetota bacterium]|jgi:endonuclease G